MSKYLPEGWTQDKIDDALELQRNAPKQEGTNMKNQAKDSLENATARPWSINKNGLEILARTEIGLIPVANLNFGMNPAEDASLIVRAVNSHDALVATLKAIDDWVSAQASGIPCSFPRHQMESALKLARGE